MRLLFDTSVLISAAVKNGNNQEWCLKLTSRAGNPNEDIEGYVSAHTLAEYYKFFTGATPQQSPRKTNEAVLALRSFLTVVCLEAGDLDRVFERCVQNAVHGGTIYDALIAQAGIRAGVDYIATVNAKDFQRLGPDVRDILLVP